MNWTDVNLLANAADRETKILYVASRSKSGCVEELMVLVLLLANYNATQSITSMSPD